ncbi:MAG: AI-2E family transporter [Clostridiales bacterium]|nr:AI-2E family transporter [Clostridiales bacterium]
MKKIKKFKFDKKYLTVSAYALAVIILALISFRIITNAETIGEGILDFFGGVASLLAVFVYGFFIAYFLNPMVRFFEHKAYRRFKKLKKARKAPRLLAIVTAYLLTFGAIFWILAYAFPEIASSFQGLLIMLRTAVDSVNRMGFAELGENEVLNDVIRSFNGIFNTEYSVRNLTDQAITPIMNLLNEMPGVLTTVYENLLEAMQNLFNFIIGMIIAFYMLYEKDAIAGRIRRVIYTFMRDQTADTVMNVSKRANGIIQGFTVGKILDSAIMGVLFLIVAMILGLPFTALLTIIFAVTNMVPYFGPIVGGVICSAIVMFRDPVMGLWTALICLVLQQLDGNIIGPKILGSSTGLKPLSVIFAIFIGGELFGPIGMFFGAPVFAVIISIVGNYIERKHKAKEEKRSKEEDKEVKEVKEDGPGAAEC